MFSARLALSISVFLLLSCEVMHGQSVRLKPSTLRLRDAPLPPAESSPLQFEPTPFTQWLDFDRLSANHWIPGELPEWLEPVSAATTRDEGGLVVTNYRLRFRGLDRSGSEIQFRIFFEDRKESAPTISAWTAQGAAIFTCGPLGNDLRLPTSEILTFPCAGVDWIEIRVPGDGRNVRGIFLSLLATRQVQHAIDFAPAADAIDAFGNEPPLVQKADDQALFGRVRAMIDPIGLRLTPDSAMRGTWEFPLESPPLLAVITFEILNADSLAPLEMILNDRPLGAVSVSWPDLADPGYLGLARPLERDMRFRYTGWLRAQKIIPGSALRAGGNSLVLQLHPDSGPLAIRAVELSLKYPWKSFDYTLSPTLP